ncbi:hypothetical protein RRG08_036673 [Elysia crispata]|uniref:Uncharacterized protein n=1 Tax=Elysia crispata TaxID=231223 RepID=A0AAE1DYT2_9GAST|nr:hypothetical protein RRG08_036673 [Elysia crispata]
MYQRRESKKSSFVFVIFDNPSLLIGKLARFCWSRTLNGISPISMMSLCTLQAKQYPHKEYKNALARLGPVERRYGLRGAPPVLAKTPSFLKLNSSCSGVRIREVTASPMDVSITTSTTAVDKKSCLV